MRVHKTVGATTPTRINDQPPIGHRTPQAHSHRNLSEFKACTQENTQVRA